MNSNNSEELAYYWNEAISNLPGDNILKIFAQQLISNKIITDDYLSLLCDFSRFCIDWLWNGEVARLVADKAYSECKKHKGVAHELSLYAAQNAAMSNILIGDYSGAVDILDKTILYESTANNKSGLSECYMKKGLALALMHHFNDSHLSLFIARKIIFETDGERSRMMARCLLYEGISYLLEHNKKAINVLAKAQSIVYDEYGEDNLLYADISLALATYFYQVGKCEEAFLGWTHAYSEYTCKLHEKNFRIAIAHFIAGKISLCAKQYEDANDNLAVAYEILKSNNISVEIQTVIESIMDNL